MTTTNPTEVASQYGPDDNAPLDYILDVAERALAHHGLDERGWTIGFDNAKKRAGRCSYTHRRITLSRHLMPIWPMREVYDTILHEIAHALAPVGAGHGPAWQHTAASIGARPERCYRPDLPKADAPWNGECPTGEHTYTRHREPTKVVSCGRCSDVFDLQNVILWRHRDGHGPGDQWNLRFAEMAFKVSMAAHRS